MPEPADGGRGEGIVVGVHEERDLPRFEILGTLRVRRGGSELALGPVKQRGVLAVLAINANRPVPVTHIVDAVWGEDPPANGANVVQKHIAGLRRVLEPDRSPRTPGSLLTLTGAGYLLSVPPECLDAEVFQRLVGEARSAAAEGRTAEAAAALERAAGLWRGAALAGLSGPVFEAARDRLTEGRAAALETWAELELRLGRHVAVVPRLVELVADYPLREQLRYLLILGLYRSGRRAEALAAFREARRFLADEFGVEPNERLQRLHRAILQGDPELSAPVEPEPGEAQPVPAGPVEAPPPAPPIQPLPPAAPIPAGLPAAPIPPGPPVEPPAAAPVSPYPAAPVSPYPAAPVSPYPAAVTYPLALPPYPIATPRPVGSPKPRTRRLGQIVAIAVPLITFGVAGWAVVGFYAARRRSWLHGLAAVGHLVVFVGAILLIAVNDVDSMAVSVGTLGLLLLWTGGTAHAAVLAFAAPRPGPNLVLGMPDVVELERKVKREQARQIAETRPDLARQLRIGRPDLPRIFDDGGLVSVNDVPEWVWAQLPGVTREQAWRIVRDRLDGHVLTSVDGLVSRRLLPAESVHLLRDVLIVVS